VRPAKRHAYQAARRGRIDRGATAPLLDRINGELEALARVIAGRTTCDVFPHVHVDDDVAHGILHVARGFNISLIAMGTHGRGASRLLVGSVAEAVLRNGRFPMLLVRPADANSEAPSHRWKEA
jgi:nucleotide-binding universal stress UspA family protein